MDTILSVQKQNFAGDGEESTKVSRAVTRSQKLFIRTIHQNLANPVKKNHGIIERPRLFAQNQTELQNELDDE